MSPFSLKNQTALITGASGGIGSAIARAYYQVGANVILSGRRHDVLDALATSLQQDMPEKGQVFVQTCDLSDRESVAHLVQEAKNHTGRLDILVNNAGLTRDNLMMRMKDDEWDSVIAVNLSSTFSACRAAIKLMMSQRYGRIINIASVVGVTGNAGQTNYCASKAGMIGMTKALAQEAATRGVTANCIAPGFIQSSMTDGLSDALKEKICSSIPMQVMGSGDDIAHAALYLASKESSYVTGQTLHVNGGMAMI